jgi:hypothetical protein
MKPPLLSSEEHQMVKDYLIIPVMLDYVHSDIETANKAGFKLDLVLVLSLQKVQDQILHEHLALKRNLRERGIKVFPERRTQTGIEAVYLCRGYQHNMTLLWDIIRTEILKKASHHVNISLI